MKAIVTVLGRDGTGIIAGVSTLLAQESINILNVSQTILDGNFTMMMKADKLSEQLKVQIAIQNQAIFDRMHQL